jgi:hypothetical protein
MRAGSRGVIPTSAFVVVAVTPTSQITPTMLAGQFLTVGFEVVEHPRISRTRSDRAVVLHAYAPGFIPDAPSESSEEALTLSLLTAGIAVAHSQSRRLRQQILARSVPRVTWPEFQPVWSVEHWCRTGHEIYVVDDTDASRQLNALSQGIGCRRSCLTIKPSVGWQDYGHPDVRSLG